MRNILLILGLIVLASGLWLLLREYEPVADVTTEKSTESQSSVESASSSTAPLFEVITSQLEVPWDIVFLPDQSLLVTERPGRVKHIDSGRVFPVDGVEHVGEGGLLGMALHPNFADNQYLYLYQTTRSSNGLTNRVVRYRYTGDELIFDRIIIDNIPGAATHDGGRIAFGPDGLLYVTVGDAANEDLAQNTASLAGSILRITDEGTIPTDNPFSNAIYSYGHRNPQGLAWDERGTLFATEHGRSGLGRTGYDELNRITSRANYGWPDSEGDEALPGTKAPLIHSGASDTWAPASAAFLDGSIFFGGLRGEALYEAVLDKSHERVIQLKEHFKGDFGRIRTVTVGPDGFLYLSTSNRDGRGDATESDDRIIRVNPALLR